jgi:DNA primase
MVSNNSVGLTECERVLVRALAASLSDPAHVAAVRAITDHPHIFDSLGVSPLLELLRNRGASDPVEAVPEGRDRQLVAQLLFSESEPVTPEEVEAAIHPLHHHHLSRRQRELRSLSLDAERKGDWVEVASLTAEKMRLDRQLRELGR